jgi:hypothetical protein
MKENPDLVELVRSQLYLRHLLEAELEKAEVGGVKVRKVVGRQRRQRRLVLLAVLVLVLLTKRDNVKPQILNLGSHCC